NPTKRLLLDNTAFSCVFCRVRYLSTTPLFRTAELHTSSLTGGQWTATSGRASLQHSVGVRSRRSTWDRSHLSSRRTCLVPSRYATTTTARSDNTLVRRLRAGLQKALSTGDMPSTSRFHVGSISAATRMYLLSQQRYLSVAPTLRDEYASTQSLDTPASIPHTSSDPSTTKSTSGLTHPQAQRPLKEQIEEDPRDLFWTLFPRVEAPEEVERRVALRIQRHSRGNKAEDLLKKSLYLRRPVAEWWSQYEGLSRRWRSLNNPVQHLQASSSIGEAEFVHMVESLKLYTASPKPAEPGYTHPQDTDRKFKLEQILNDTHAFLSLDATEVYRELFRTVRFWREQDQLSSWVKRIREGIATSPLYPDPEARLSRYHQLMDALAKENELSLLEACFRSIGKDLKLEQLTVNTYNALIRGYLKTRNTHRATESFQEMIAKGIQPSCSTFNILIQGYLANRDFLSSQRALESLLLSNVRPDIDTFNNLMAGYFNAGQYDIGYGFYKGLSEYGVVPNATTYYYLMKSYMQRRETNRVVELFLQMKHSDNADMHPTARAYRLLVQALVQDGRISDALKVLQEIRSDPGVEETATIYNVVLNHYAKRQDGVRARRVLDWILQRRLVPSQGSFNPLIQLYLETGEYDLAKEMTTMMIEHGVAPSTVTYNLLIKSTKSQDGRRQTKFEKEGLQSALNLYREMVQQGLEPDVWTYNILLDLMVRQLTPRSREYSHQYNKGNKSQLRNNRRGDAAQAAANRQIQQQVMLMEELLLKMKTAKIRPDHGTYGTLIHHYVLLGNIEAAEMLFHDMIKVHGVTPNPYICNTLLNGFVTAGEMDKALELFRRMPKKYGVDPTATTLTTLIKGYCHQHDLAAAQMFAQLLQEDPRLELDQYSIHMLMHLAQKSQQPGLALDFLEMMRARGIEPDKVTYTTLINALSKRQEQTSPTTSSLQKQHPDEYYPTQQRTTRQSSPLRPTEYDHYPDNRNSDETAAAVDKFLSMVQQEKYPIHHTEITTILSAYFRLGRPRAAIEFFRASVRKADPKVSTSNCGALISGLLRPEFGRRYDGTVLNLYSRMLTVTRSRLQREQEGGEGMDSGKVVDDDAKERSLPPVHGQSDTKGTSTSEITDDQQRQQQNWSLPESTVSQRSALAGLGGVSISVIRDLMVSRVADEEDSMEKSAFVSDASTISTIVNRHRSSVSSGENGQNLIQVLEQIASGFGSRCYEKQVPITDEEKAAATSEVIPIAASSMVSSTSKTSSAPATTLVESDQDNGALPSLDLITMRILIRAFSERQDWSIVAQLWKDLMSLPVEQLYPHEIPFEVIGLASQAFYRMAAKLHAAEQHRRQVEPTFSQWTGPLTEEKREGDAVSGKEGEEHSPTNYNDGDQGSSNSNSGRQRVVQAQEYMALSHQLLRQIWLQNPVRGSAWSMKIYGYDIFGAKSSPSSSSSSPSASSPNARQKQSRRKESAAFGRRAKGADTKAQRGDSSFQQQASSSY
ncbi:hypothetical protein BGW41_003596, partial [Actinomortierella wolfii]